MNWYIRLALHLFKDNLAEFEQKYPNLERLLLELTTIFGLSFSFHEEEIAIYAHHLVYLARYKKYLTDKSIISIDDFINVFIISLIIAFKVTYDYLIKLKNAAIFFQHISFVLPGEIVDLEHLKNIKELRKMEVEFLKRINYQTHVIEKDFLTIIPQSERLSIANSIGNVKNFSRILSEKTLEIKHERKQVFFYNKKNILEEGINKQKSKFNKKIDKEKTNLSLKLLSIEGIIKEILDNQKKYLAYNAKFHELHTAVNNAAFLFRTLLNNTGRDRFDYGLNGKSEEELILSKIYELQAAVANLESFFYKNKPFWPFGKRRTLYDLQKVACRKLHMCVHDLSDTDLYRYVAYRQQPFAVPYKDIEMNNLRLAIIESTKDREVIVEKLKKAEVKFVTNKKNVQKPHNGLLLSTNLQNIINDNVIYIKDAPEFGKKLVASNNSFWKKINKKAAENDETCYVQAKLSP